LVFGGRGLTLPGAEHLRFVVRGSGEYAVLRARPGRVETVVPWTAGEEVSTKGATASATNTLRVVTTAADARFYVNDLEVATVPLTEAGANGIVGLWIGAGSDVHVAGFGIR
jgi:hypothetical protein